MTSQLLIALFVGLSIPVIGAGVALDQGASAPNTVLGFAILFGLGVAGAGWGSSRAGRRARRKSHDRLERTARIALADGLQRDCVTA